MERPEYAPEVPPVTEKTSRAGAPHDAGGVNARGERTESARPSALEARRAERIGHGTRREAHEERAGDREGQALDHDAGLGLLARAQLRLERRHEAIEARVAPAGLGELLEHGVRGLSRA